MINSVNPAAAIIICVITPTIMPLTAIIAARAPPEMPDAMINIMSEPGVRQSTIVAPINVIRPIVSIAKMVVNIAPTYSQLRNARPDGLAVRIIHQAKVKQNQRSITKG